MKLRIGAMLIVAMAGLSESGHGQERDAQVLGPGQLRIRAGAEYLHHSTRFGASGRVPFDGGYGGPLTLESLFALEPLASDLDLFFMGTGEQSGGVVFDPASLLVGDLSAEVGWNTRSFPVGIALGVFPRAEVGVRLPIFRNERYTRRFDLAGGNLGLNPDVAANTALMASISPGYAGLGAAPVLPVAGSPIADELQHRVVALTGDELALPDSPLTASGLESTYDVGAFAYLLTEWRPGDLEIEGRVALLRSFPGLHPPPGDRIHHRVSTHVVARLPTGARGEENPLLDAGPDVGFGGATIGVDGDLFVRDRLWISAAGSYTRFSARDVAIAIVPPGGPFAPDVEIREARIDRGSEVDLWLSPRLLLTREISFGATLRSEQVGEGHHQLADLTLPLSSRSRQSLGFSFRYTTLPVAAEGRSVLPFDVAIGFRASVRGSDDVLATRAAFLQVSVVPRLWGGE